MPQPTCGYVLKKDYIDYVGGARRRAGRRAHLRRRRVPDEGAQGRGTTLDIDFTGHVPATVTYHTPCHLKAQNVGLKSRDLIKLTGAKVTLVQQCSGIDGMWGLRAENTDISVPIAEKLADEIRRADGEVDRRRLPPGQHRDHRADRAAAAAPAAAHRPGLRHQRGAGAR